MKLDLGKDYLKSKQMKVSYFFFIYFSLLKRPYCIGNLNSQPRSEIFSCFGVPVNTRPNGVTTRSQSVSRVSDTKPSPVVNFTPESRLCSLHGFTSHSQSLSHVTATIQSPIPGVTTRSRSLTHVTSTFPSPVVNCSLGS